ncbi:MAG TPA: hypothetical protein VGK32_08245 [Vicinamibacterales bacterium]|jgi:hypothetical protein
MPTPDRPKPSASRVNPPPIPSSARRPAAVSATPASPAPAAVPDKPTYHKWAFVNPFNLSLLVGGLGAAVLTVNPILALATLGLETIWLVNADSVLLKRFVWDPKFEQLRRDAEDRERALRVQGLGERERTRVEDLTYRQAEIQRLAAQNPSLTGDLLRAELKKTDKLVEAFIEMAVTSARYESYLQSVDVVSLDADRSRLERDIKLAKDGEPTIDLAKKNLAIILKRLEKMQEIRRYLEVARGQLDLIENSFQLIADQIVTMQSPQQLSGQLNELLDGVESIRQTALETEAVLGTL